MSVFFWEFLHEVPALPSPSKFPFLFCGVPKISALSHESILLGATIKQILKFKRFFCSNLQFMEYKDMSKHLNMTISLSIYLLKKRKPKTNTKPKQITTTNNKKPTHFFSKWGKNEAIM